MVDPTIQPGDLWWWFFIHSPAFLAVTETPKLATAHREFEVRWTHSLWHQIKYLNVVIFL